MTTHSSILAWKIPWTEEPGGYSPWGHKESDMTELTPPVLISPSIKSRQPYLPNENIYWKLLCWAPLFNSHFTNEEIETQRKDAQVGSMETVVGHQQSGPRVPVLNAALYNLTGVATVNTKPYLNITCNVSGVSADTEYAYYYYCYFKYLFILLVRVLAVGWGVVFLVSCGI